MMKLLVAGILLTTPAWGDEAPPCPANRICGVEENGKIRTYHQNDPTPLPASPPSPQAYVDPPAPPVRAQLPPQPPHPDLQFHVGPFSVRVRVPTCQTQCNNLYGQIRCQTYCW